MTAKKKPHTFMGNNSVRCVNCGTELKNVDGTVPKLYARMKELREWR